MIWVAKELGNLPMMVGSEMAHDYLLEYVRLVRDVDLAEDEVRGNYE